MLFRSYLLRHWKALTTFLREAGAPLDNNLCERALKRADRWPRLAGVGPQPSKPARSPAASVYLKDAGLALRAAPTRTARNHPLCLAACAKTRFMMGLGSAIVV